MTETEQQRVLNLKVGKAVVGESYEDIIAVCSRLIAFAIRKANCDDGQKLAYLAEVAAFMHDIALPNPQQPPTLRLITGGKG